MTDRSWVNIPTDTWTDVPAAGLCVFAPGPGSGALVQVLPDSQVRILGAYEIRLELMTTRPPHATCADVSTIGEPRHSRWICTADCPPAIDQV